MKDSDREALFAELRQFRGAMQEVVRETQKIKSGGYSRTYVYQVLNGVAVNSEILAVATEVLVHWKQRQADTERRIESGLRQYRAIA